MQKAAFSGGFVVDKSIQFMIDYLHIAHEVYMHIIIYFDFIIQLP